MSNSIGTDGNLNPKNNPKWPPVKDKYIIVQKRPNGQIYSGVVRKILENNTGLLILLSSGQTSPNNPSELTPYLTQSSDDPKRFMLVIETDSWNYSSPDDKISNAFSGSFGFEHKLEHKGELLYDDIRSRTSTLSNKYYSNASEEPNTNVALAQIIDAQDMDDFAFLLRNDDEYVNTQGRKELELVSQTVVSDDYPVQYYVGDYIPYKTIIGKLEGTILIEKTESIDVDKSENIINKIHNNPTTPYDILITDQDMIYKFVNSTHTMRTEANKIIKFLSDAFFLTGEEAEQNADEDKVYGQLKFIYYNGYVHIFRKDIPLKEVITKELLKDTDPENPKLKVLGDTEYNIPIRHNVLKYVLFQNELQRTLVVDRQLLREVELILSQEYIIALTPEPRYQLWCVIRLIKLWFGDIDLQNNIRKIKMIVNQYRTRSDKKYNIYNGIRFSIGIYPRYGKTSATIVLKKLIYYFTLYFQAIGWKNNPPSYFKIVNDLIAYTNCSQTLKLYYRKISETNGDKKNHKVFSNNYTMIDHPDHNTDILEQYVELSNNK